MLWWLGSLASGVLVILSARYLLGGGAVRADYYVARNTLRGWWERLQHWADQPVRTRRWWVFLRQQRQAEPEPDPVWSVQDALAYIYRAAGEGA